MNGLNGGGGGGVGGGGGGGGLMELLCISTMAISNKEAGKSKIVLNTHSQTHTHTHTQSLA